MTARTGDDPRAFYDAYGEREWDRLAESLDGRLEFEETVYHLERHLPREGRILDVGGGAGRYAVWLAERGHEVTLVDLSRGQLAVAADRIAERGLEDRVDLHQGTATALPVPDDAFDATLCLGGALSHLLDADDRAAAAAELHRATAEGGPVVASVMGLLGALQLYLLSGAHLEALPAILEDGDCDQARLESHGYKHAFTATHLFRRAELDALLSDAGLDVETVVGLEGLGSPFHDDHIREAVADRTDAESDAIRRLVRATNDDPVVADLSVHMLAVAHADPTD